MFELLLQLLYLHEAEWDIGIRTPHMRPEEQHELKDSAGQHAPPSVFPFSANSIDDIKRIAALPKPGKVTGIALAVGINLEREWDPALASRPVAPQTRLSMAHVLLVDNLEPWPELPFELLQDVPGCIR